MSQHQMVANRKVTIDHLETGAQEAQARSNVLLEKWVQPHALSCAGGCDTQRV